MVFVERSLDAELSSFARSKRDQSLITKTQHQVSQLFEKYPFMNIKTYMRPL